MQNSFFVILAKAGKRKTRSRFTLIKQGETMNNLASMLHESAMEHAQRVALISNVGRMTYHELEQAACSLGNHLRSLGLGKGDKIAIMLPNCPEFVVAYFGVQKTGGVAVTLHTQSTSYELAYLLENSDSRCLITQQELARRFEDIRETLPLCRHLITTGAPEQPSSFRDIIEKGPSTIDLPDLEGDDPAAMIYTSGLTGKPHGAVLTHRNLYTQSELLRTIVNSDETDVGLAVIPFFHTFGAVANMLAPLRIGAGVVLMDRFTLDGIFAAIEKEKVTYIAAVPRLFLGMFFHDKAANYSLQSLKICITGGAAMPVDFIPLFEGKFGVKIMEGYGLTEASPAASFSRLNMPQKPGSIGIPIPGVEAKIVDDAGHERARGEVGELVIKGENVMKGYYKEEKATARVIKDGWLFTGDLARMDADGYIFITGRKKRMIITSGFNVYPKEIENVINLHPAVQESLVVGKEDLLRGEIVRAIVVKKPGMHVEERELLKHCRTYLSSYKSPREIEFAEAIDHPEPLP